MCIIINLTYRKTRLLSGALACFLLFACSTPQSGPDKTAAGASLGAGWGAGTGAIIGHQLSSAGPGVAVGAGLGLAAGAISGYAYDTTEEGRLKLENELASLKAANMANHNELASIQAKLDRAAVTSPAAGFYQVYFDQDETSLKPGAIADLEHIAEMLKTSPHAYRIQVEGHTDDAGSPEYNKRLAEARARNVSSYLAARGISMDQIKVSSFGSSRPVASNATPAGRQLNRRVAIYISNK